MSQTHTEQPAAVESFDRTGILVLIVICLATFASGMNAMGLQPFLVSVGDDLGVSVPSVGQAVTVTLLMSAICGLIAGPVADHYGHRRLMVLGAVVLALSAIGSAVSPTYGVFMIFRFIGGLSLALLNGLSLAIAGSYFAGEARRRALSVTVSAMSGTAIIGVPLLSWIGDAFSWRWAFGMIGIVAMILIPILATLIPPSLAATRHFQLSQLMSAYRPLLAQRAVVALYVGSFLRAIFWLGILNYFGAFLIEDHGLTLRQVGITYMFGGMGFLLGGLAAGGRVGQFNHRSLFSVVTITGAIFFGLAYAAPVGPIGSVFLLTIGGFFGAIGWVVLNTMMANESHAGAGTTMSLNTAFFNLGSAAGGAVGGALLVIGSYSALGLFLPMLAVIASLIVMASGRFRTADGQPQS